MSDEEVRHQFEPSVQPAPFLRSMAVIELERRRQRRTEVLLRPNFNVGRLAVGFLMLAALLAAVTVGLKWSGYVG